MLTTAAILVLATFVTCGTAYYGGSPVLEAMAEPVPDYETTNYLLPRLVAKYRAPHPSQGDWESASDPRFYLLTELDRDASQAASRRVKRTGGGPSLSIVNPLDVLRQRLLLEIARRRMRQSQDQIQANRDFLQSIGKREVANRTDNEVADYIVSPAAAEKSGMPAPETNRSPESPEWSAAPVSRWNNEYTSLHQS